MLPQNLLEGLWNFYVDVYVPHWHACLYGPMPNGGISIDHIVRPTRDEAEESMWMLIEEACREHDIEFNMDDWELHHLYMLNSN